MRNGILLKSRVSEICIKRICVNQGVGVFQIFVYSELNLLAVGTLNITFAKFTQDLKWLGLTAIVQFPDQTQFCILNRIWTQKDCK